MGLITAMLICTHQLDSSVVGSEISFISIFISPLALRLRLSLVANFYVRIGSVNIGVDRR